MIDKVTRSVGRILESSIALQKMKICDATVGGRPIRPAQVSVLSEDLEALSTKQRIADLVNISLFLFHNLYCTVVAL